jgi:hypothetical protein
MGAVEGGLDRLVEVENRLKSSLLQQNYERPNPRTWSTCKKHVIDYVLHTDSVADKKVIFVKFLTKVADHVWDDRKGSELESNKVAHVFLTHLFKFNREGYGATHRCAREEGYSLHNLISMQAHFERYAADTAQHKSGITDNHAWPLRWWRHARRAAALSFDTDPMFSAYSLFSAGEAAIRILSQTHNPFWHGKATSHFQEVLAIGPDMYSLGRLRKDSSSRLSRLEGYKVPLQYAHAGV